MKRKTDLEIYFTPKQAAEHFNLSLSTVKNYIYAGKLRTLKTPGGHHRIRKSELLATLGDITLSEGDENRYNLLLKLKLCTAMLTVFKTMGSAGNSLTLHSQNVSRLSSDIARAMDMTDADIKRIEMAGLVHDIGHMAVERRILFKSDHLTPSEYDSLKNHPAAGEKMLNSIKELKEIADIIVQHHERVDGGGYPKGLKEEDILKAARIISVTEAYDSMVSAHSYKNPISKEIAISELLQHSGTQFDGDIVEVFTKII